MRKWIGTIREVGKWIGTCLFGVSVGLFLLGCFNITFMPFGCWYVLFWLSLIMACGFPYFLPRDGGSSAEHED